MADQLGLRVFEEAFKDYQDQYVLIGGSATQLAIEDAGQQFSRTTKDLDIVVIVDALTTEFIERFWQLSKRANIKSNKRVMGPNSFIVKKNHKHLVTR